MIFKPDYNWKWIDITNKLFYILLKEKNIKSSKYINKYWSGLYNLCDISPAIL